MAWFSVRGLLVAAVVTTGGCVSSRSVSAAPNVPAATPAATPAPMAPAPRVAPTRPVKLWPTTRLLNADYVSVRDVAEYFALKPAWTKSQLAMTLSDTRGVRFTFDAGQKDCYFDGLRVFLGTPVLMHKDSLWVSKLDVIKLVAPLCRPADHLAFLPATAPRTIVLDAGHGGIDPGTQNLKLGLSEKVFTLDVALRLKNVLELWGWRVLMIRTDDRELSKDKKADLQMRNDFANQQHADLFLSIHFNSAPEAITGIETYTMAPQFMFSTGDETGDDMTKVAYPSNRLDYANLMFGEKVHRALLAGLKTPDRGFKRGRRAVLRMLDCPGALVECGYLSNNAEARRVATPEFRQQIAEALAVGVRNYAGALAELRPAPKPTN